MVLRGLGAEAVLGPPPTPTTDAGDLQRPRILPRAQVDLKKRHNHGGACCGLSGLAASDRGMPAGLSVQAGTLGTLGVLSRHACRPAQTDTCDHTQQAHSCHLQSVRGLRGAPSSLCPLESPGSENLL